jgi:nicotinamidase-related amidase
MAVAGRRRRDPSRRSGTRGETDRGQAPHSPFVGTDLETLLRANGIDTLVLAGVHSSGVVLSTVRRAGDLDYRLVVVRDCCRPRWRSACNAARHRHREAGGSRHHGGVRRRPAWQVFMNERER